MLMRLGNYRRIPRNIILRSGFPPNDSVALAH